MNLHRRAYPLMLAMAIAATPVAAQKQPAGNADADPIEWVEADDPAMDAAIAQAQATLPEWLGVLANPPRGYANIVFKFPLGGTEHIWVDNVRREGDMLHGTLANNPFQPGWAIGDRVSVPLADVSDWAYFDAAGVAHGYRTIVVLFSQMDPAEVAAIRRNFGWSKR